MRTSRAVQRIHVGNDPAEEEAVDHGTAKNYRIVSARYNEECGHLSNQTADPETSEKKPIERLPRIQVSEVAAIDSAHEHQNRQHLSHYVVEVVTNVNVHRGHPRATDEQWAPDR
jgi:hypothetical protein